MNAVQDNRACWWLRLARRLGIILGTVLGAIMVLAGATLGYSAYRYSTDMHIDRVRGVDEGGYMQIGGIPQWVQIRGQDRNNPVLLWVHGGPGGTTIHSTYYFRDWERFFTVVMWDQRGAGRSFARSGKGVAPTMNIDRMTQDGIEVTEYLRAHLHKQKIILLGHSWGSLLGVHMVHQRPDLFAAYVGTGQYVNFHRQAAAAYPLLIERAQDLGNTAIADELTRAGAPPDPSALGQWMQKAGWTALTWANESDPGGNVLPLDATTPWQLWQRITSKTSAGVDFSVRVLLPAIMGDDLPSLGLDFDVPVYIFQGADDLVTDTDVVRDYYERIRAPAKDLVLFRYAGHMTVFNARARFLRELVRHLRPDQTVRAAPGG